MDYKKVVVLLAVGIIVLLAMIMFVGPGQIFEALKTANINYVILAIIIQFVIIWLWNIRWSIICDSLDIPHNKLSLFAMTIVGLAINDLTPSGRSGGEPVRAYLLSKSSSADFKTTFAISYLMLYMHLSTALFSLLMISLVIFIVALVFIVFVCINESFGIKTIQWVFRQLRKLTSRDLDKYEDTATTSLVGFQSSLLYLMDDHKLLVIATVISFVVWFLELTRVYVVFLAFGVQVSLGMIAAVFLVSTLIGIIPILPGGLGSIDGGMILLYSLAGITTSISTAATLIERMISLWMVIIIGLILLPFFGAGVLDYIDSG